MSSKIIFLDVDGTLINYQTQTPPSAKVAVEKARANGHKVYLCTGCCKYELSLRDLPEVDGLIGANGGYVENGTDVLLSQSFTKEETRAIIDWCNARHLGMQIEANSGLYCNEYMLAQGEEVFSKYAMGKGADKEAAKKKAGGFVSSLIPLYGEAQYRDDIFKISFVLSSYQDHLDSQKEFPNFVARTWGGKGEMALFGDLSPQGINKQQGILTLLADLGASKEDTISFGDAKVDISMFELCGYNVAMGNGGDEIKAAADYVTDDVDDDGLYRAFEKLGLL